MYFTREAQTAPEEIEANHNGSVAPAAAEQVNEYDPGVLRVFSAAHQASLPAMAQQRCYEVRPFHPNQMLGCASLP